MKLGIYTDPHCSSQEVTCGVRQNSRSLEKLRAAYGYFEREGCSLAICLGDLTDRENSREKERENLKKIAGVLGASSVPTVCLMGNHDAFVYTKDEFYGILGADTRPVNRVFGGGFLLFLDACYYKDGTPYRPGGTDWTDTCCPGEEALAPILSFAHGDVYVFVHQNLDPAVEKRHLICNAGRINDILFESGKVKAVYQGHYHPGCRSVLNGIRYVTLPAMCENENAFFTEEI